MTTAYGPYHRRRARYQEQHELDLQVKSSEIWGKPIKFGGKFPYVKAYATPLCYPGPAHDGCHDGDGIEFATHVKPAQKMPNGMTYWSMEEMAPPGCRRIDDETIALPVTILKVVHT
tara:strand:+ start:209 stop:559 length:351 start_codon:yes stop_codon:yes gene_type:complete